MRRPRTNTPARIGPGPRAALAVVSALLLLGAAPALALIDPSFTPIHLVRGAQDIACGTLEARKPPGRWALADLRVLKGDRPKAAGLSLAVAGPTDAADARRFLASAEGSPAMLFRGADTAYLLVRNVWLELKPAGGGDFRITGYDDRRMLRVYGGAADKLIEMTEYILRDKDADVPVAVGVKWEKHLPVGRLPQAPNGMAALTGGKGRADRLLAASPGGDRLFAYDKTKGRFEDRTANMGLDTASRALALVDLDRDGLGDLVSWDGQRLTVRRGRKDGGFSPPAARKGDPLRMECSALTAISPSQDGAPGLLVSAPWPHVLTWAGEAWRAQALPGRKAHRPAGDSSGCVAADWDGDGYVDVLQLRERESLLWRGRKGGFDDPRTCAVRSGGAPGRWCVGDFGTAGRLDLLVCGRRANQLWEPAGGGGFRPVIRYARSLDRMRAGAADCLTADLNHDGRQDVVVLTGAGHLAYHFNRGYRLLADEGELKLDARPADPKSARAFKPLRAAAGDFNGDGRVDLAVAYGTGEVFCYFNGRSADPAETPGLRVALPPGRTGPVTVSVWQGRAYPVCVGTYLIEAHSPPTYVSLRRRGACTLRALVVSTIRPDTVFIPYHWSGAKSANQLTISAQDPISKIPEYKVCAVRVQKAEAPPEYAARLEAQQ